MSEICLQNILFQGPPALPGTDALYLRPLPMAAAAPAAKTRTSLTLPPGTKLKLDSYMNMFSYHKWKTWCHIDKLNLRFEYKGDVVVTVFNKTKSGGIEISRTALSGGKNTGIEIPAGENYKLLSIKLETKNGCTLSNAGWYADSTGGPSKSGKKKRGKIKPAVVICTYKREDYLKNTLDVLKDGLPAGWQAIIIDNSSSLTDTFKKPYNGRFTFFANPNTGGSGGFSRGITEADAEGCTHAVLMDDDIVIDPEALFRTNSLLTLLKPEYNAHFVAGSMLRIDKPCIQHESTAVWNGISVRGQKHNLDLSQAKDILRNEKPHKKQKRKNSYAGWWYCVIPLNHTNSKHKSIETDLPFPMFVGADDIEYSLRRAEGFLELNGICVWHPPFEGKNNPVRQHYLSTRNGLITNAMHRYPLYKSLLLVLLRLMRETLKGSRETRGLIKHGLADFLKGPAAVSRIGNPFEAEYSRKVKLQIIKLIKEYTKVGGKYRESISEHDYRLV